MSNARNLARLLPNASGQLPDAAMASGSVLQVVFADMTGNEVYVGGSTAVTTNFSATITPLSTSSKIIVIASLCTRGDGGDINFGAYDLYRNGTKIADSLTTWSENNVNQQLSGLFTDSPNSVSAQTYTWYIKSAGTAHDVRFNPALVGALNPRSTMVLLEIAG